MPESFASAVAGLHAAMADVANGDNAAIEALYSHRATPPASTAARRGWAAEKRRWDWAGRQFGGGAVNHENVTMAVTAELAYTTDIETCEVRMDGMDRPARWSNRVTHVFRLEDGAWRLVSRLRQVDQRLHFGNPESFLSKGPGGRPLTADMVASGLQGRHLSPHHQAHRARLACGSFTEQGRDKPNHSLRRSCRPPEAA